MLELVVIADDLTGAADTGIQFQPVFAPVYLVSRRFRPVEALPAAARALSIYTASRALPPAEARRVVSAACGRIAGLAPRRIYKKIDSTLRGNVGAELEAVMEALNRTMSFIAPALIEQGRTTLDGVHRIHGTPVADTEMRHDPVTPVRESRLADWLGRQTRFPVAHIDLAMLNLGPAAVSGVIDRARGQGVRHFTFDAAEREHLELIAHLALQRHPEALLCGSAGLAQSMARALGARAASAPPECRQVDGPLSGHWLFACGSASERLRQQVGVLAERTDVTVVTFEPAWLTAGSPAAGRAEAIHRAAARLAAADVVVRLPPPSEDARTTDPGRLAAGFAEAIGAVIAATRPAGLFLSGGDTALAVLERLGAHAIRLEREVGCGLVLGTLIGGAAEGLPLVTKAGAFGPADVLLGLRGSRSGGRDAV
jgi:uncharacterized protein YgbK (DUF1537 family)